jgi:hypothetical protein
MTTPDTAAQIAMLEALKERVERGELVLSYELIQTPSFRQDAVLALYNERKLAGLVKYYEAADAFERAVYPMEPGEDAYITTREGGECEYERLPCVTYAPTIPAAKVIWVLVRRMKELRERENAND